MSTIASPRDPGTPLPRRVPSSQAITSPTSSQRASLDIPRSATASPNPGNGGSGGAPSSTAATGPANPGRRNRAALREYYNLPKSAAPPAVEVTDPLGIITAAGGAEASEVPPSEMDKDDFDSAAYVQRALAENGLEDLLRLYTRVLGETRALDAEKKALVYDNYSKLITATETIRKMRTNMDPLNPMASTLDPAIAQIYSQASSIRDSLRASISPPDAASREAEEKKQKKARAKKLAAEVLDTPGKVRALVSAGRVDEAKQAWKMPRKLLLVWKEQDVGGDDVELCLQDGDAALRGESGQGNWREAAEERPEGAGD